MNYLFVAHVISGDCLPHYDKGPLPTGKATIFVKDIWLNWFAFTNLNNVFNSKNSVHNNNKRLPRSAVCFAVRH